MATLFFASEARFIKVKEKIYSLGGFSYPLWERYLKVFDDVCIIARVLEDDKATFREDLVSNGNHVTFAEVPYYIGPKQYLRKRRAIKKAINQIVEREGAYLCRVPGKIGSLVVKALKKKRKKYACEIVGDPWDVCAPGGLKTFGRPVLRVVSTLELKKIVRESNASLYVTKKTLQKRYPSNSNAFQTSASDVSLPLDVFSDHPHLLNKKDVFTIVSIGSLEQMYKAPDVLLKAVKDVINKGVDVKLIWAGGGKHIQEMKELSKTLQIQDSVSFIGGVSREKVMEYLHDADLFVLASRTEGLPRAVIEAMACGLPCIGTRVGGIPELLDEEVLVQKDNVMELSEKITKILTDENFYNSQSAKNLEKAQSYSEVVLVNKRESFYKFIRENLLNIK